MDPNATLSRIECLANEMADDGYSVTAEADELCATLYGWLQAGGFRPNFNEYETGNAYYRAWLERR